MKILGLDFGTKRIGLAISDESQTLARELAIVSPKEIFDCIKAIMAEEGLERIVVGLPLNMSGEDSDKTREVRAFVGELKNITGLPVEMVDERLSSVMAEHLPGGGKNTDSLAAQIILQNYLDSKKAIS